MDAESCTGIGWSDFYGSSLSHDDLCPARACLGDDAQRLRHARHFLANGSAEPGGESQPDCLAHAAFMSTQALCNMIARGELIGSAVLIVIGVALIALSPAKEPVSS
jgi:hypothetical protein